MASILAAMALLLAAACGGEGGVAEARAGYIADKPTFAVVAAAGSEEATEAEADAGAEAADEESGAAQPAPVTILLDFLIHNQGSGSLDSVTVDLTIADPDGNEKERRLLWVETAGLTKGSQRQVAHELTDIAYTEGDGFHVEVRHPIPMEDRGGYREFDVEN